jgi:hypothetical protein
VNPLTRRWSAARRPHFVLLFALALLFIWATPAEAGRRGRRSKKARDRSRAAAQAQADRQKPTPAPEPAAARNDGPGEERDRLAKGEGRAAGKSPADRGQREKVFDFTGFELAGSERMPQLLYFLDRAEEELERASLERRSFVPEMMRSLDEEDL